MNSTDAASIYVLFHIPEVDDPWRTNFSIDLNNPQGNVVSQMMREVQYLSPELAKELYPYSSWTVPLEIRKMWENTILNSKVEVKGLFAGHFHSNKKAIYEGWDWLKDTRYNPKILSMLHIYPPLSVKNQAGFASDETARGFLEVRIDKAGNPIVQIHWVEGN